MLNYVVLVNSCQKCKENAIYYSNVLTKLWEELRTCARRKKDCPKYEYESQLHGLPSSLFESWQIFFQLVAPHKIMDEDSEKEVEKDEETWINLSECSDYDINFKRLLNSLERTKLTENLKPDNIAEKLHLIADKLPSHGYVLDIFWVICGSSECVNISNNIPLYGVLKRLQMWNSAHITWIFDPSDLTDSIDNFYESWNKELDISLKNLRDTESFFSDHNIVWHGSLTCLEDQQTEQSDDSRWFLSRPHYSSFLQISVSNCNRSAECGTKREIPINKEFLRDRIVILQELSIANDTLETQFTILDHLNTQLSLFLSTEGQRYHKTLLQQAFRIKESLRFSEQDLSKKETVLLASIETCQILREAKPQTTKDWIEFVNNDLDNAATGKFLDRAETLETFYLLLYPREPGMFDVYFMRPQKSLSHLHAMLSVYGACLPLAKPSNDAVNELQNTINSLPKISTDLFSKWMKEFDEEYFRCFADQLSIAKGNPKKDEKPSLSASELSEILLNCYTETRNVHCLPSKMSVSEDLCSENSWPQPYTEERVYAFDQEIWPEKQWLKWLDSICSLPASPLKSQSFLAVHLDASEMLKHFTRDGKPLKKELQALRRQIEEKRKNSPSKYEGAQNGEATLGIEYCSGNTVTSTVGSFSPKLFPKHVRHETLSICNTPKTLAKAKLQGLKRKAVSESQSESNTENKTAVDAQPSSSKPTDRCSRKGKAKPDALRKTSSLTEKTMNERGSKRPPKNVRKGGTTEAKTDCSSSQDSKLPKKKRRSFDGTETCLLSSECSSNAKEKRSDRHKRRLARVVKRALTKYGVDPEEDYFETCSERLYYLCKSFLKDLKTSEGLNNEMKRLADSNVANVVEFEKRRRATKPAENQ